MDTGLAASIMELVKDMAAVSAQFFLIVVL